MTEGIKLDPDSDPWDKITLDLQFHAKKSNMSYRHVARLLGRSYSNVSNIMTGRRRIKEEDAAKLDAHWELGQHFTWLLKQARRQANHDREWFKAYLGHEAAADTIKTYEALAVPGLFQLPEYAAALIGALGTQDVEEQVARRMARQVILSKRSPPTIWALLSQNALDWPVGGSEVMRNQLAHLLGLAELPNVGLRVVPRSAGAHAGFSGSFTLLFGESGDVAHTEASGRGRLVESPSEVREYWDRYDRIGQSALPERASLELIEKLMKEL
ncbi:helix-turn-helix domain-containing protein [Actinoallomurus rhizosphaericola]|uniref:helix-turn-helix domain-containing protein n=1 Tax=Actinoallomurus rhizosphaericola TaxID=2952536 RepID=UPI0020918EED|nr:helix-turn-helix transcriptional regulator [Actinoallomurus rhizosphaericola]MCO5993859.1 helix-turn-helix transcriptional regulator [Actinoallomurus rhizosphaericola]